MRLFANARVRIRQNCVTYVRRRLTGEQGEISVVEGDEVYPEYVIGESQPSAGFRTINLSTELGVDSHRADLYLKRKIGQTIYRGELLAEGVRLLGFKNKMLLSPVDGVLDFYDPEKGNLRIRLLPHRLKVASGVYGVVDKVDKNSGVVFIRTAATVVYGVLGSGQEREGILKLLDSSSMLVSSKQLQGTLHGQMVVGGSTVLLDALQKAVSMGVAGIISGGINAGDYKTMTGGNWNLSPLTSTTKWTDVGMTLLVTEGFGVHPISEDIFLLLGKFEGRFVIGDGNRARLILPTTDQNSMMYIRKTKLPPHSFVQSEPEIELAEIKVGGKVRVVSEQFMGAVGKVESIDRTPTQLPSGIMTFMVTVSTLSRKLRVPYLNIEIC